MAHLDRLSALVAHVDMHATPLDTPDGGNVAIIDKLGQPKTLLLWRDLNDLPAEPFAGTLNLRLEFGGPDNPLCHALPRQIAVDLENAPSIARIAEALRDEVSAARCGSAFALERLSEVLLIGLLRNHIEKAGSATGLLAGLAHPGLARVLVAMHETPGRAWRVDDFLPIAGMSRSQFMATFQKHVGKTPMSYLKAWRMGLAHKDVARGDRISTIARRYGYRSADSFCRAFAAKYGIAPSYLREEPRASNAIEETNQNGHSKPQTHKITNSSHAG